MHPLFRLTLLLVIAAALTGCDESASAPPAMVESIPLGDGDRWIYQIHGSYSSGSLAVPVWQMVTNEGTQTVDGEVTVRQVVRNADNFELLSERFLQRTGDSVIERFLPGHGPHLDAASLPVEALRLPLRAGTRFQAGHWPDLDAGRDFDRDFVNDTVSITREVIVDGFDSVATPAGTFVNVTRVTIEERFTYTWTASHTQTTKLRRVQRWIEPELGDVQIVDTFYNANGVATDEITHVLVGYSVGGKRSETDAPAIVDLLPAADEPVTAWPDIRFAFSNTLDIDRIADHISINLLRSDGTPVPAHINVTQFDARINITGPLLPGTYTLQVNGAIDLLGNELMNYSHEFVVEDGEWSDPLHLLPLAVGDQRLFDVYDGPGTFRVREAVTGHETLDSANRFVVRRSNADTGAVLGERTLVQSMMGLTEVFAAGAVPYGIPGTGLIRLPAPMETGRDYRTISWLSIDTGRDDDGDGINEQAAVTATVRAEEQITPQNVPAGTFTNAVKVRTTTRYAVTASASGNVTEYVSTLDEWLVPEVGVIKRVVNEESPEGTHFYSEDLVEYSLGGGAL